MTQFSEIRLGRIFEYNGSLWLKQSSRTARLMHDFLTDKQPSLPRIGYPDLVCSHSWFYFGKNDSHCHDYYAYGTTPYDIKAGKVITMNGDNSHT
jgi:hypothetical protein